MSESGGAGDKGGSNGVGEGGKVCGGEDGGDEVGECSRGNGGSGGMAGYDGGEAFGEGEQSGVGGDVEDGAGGEQDDYGKDGGACGGSVEVKGKGEGEGEGGGGVSAADEKKKIFFCGVSAADEINYLRGKLKAVEAIALARAGEQGLVELVERLDIDVAKSQGGILGIDINDNVIQALVAGTPAAELGSLLVGDRIVACDGQLLGAGQQVFQLLEQDKRFYRLTVVRAAPGSQLRPAGLPARHKAPQGRSSAPSDGLDAIAIDRTAKGFMVGVDTISPSSLLRSTSFNRSPARSFSRGNMQVLPKTPSNSSVNNLEISAADHAVRSFTRFKGMSKEPTAAVQALSGPDKA
uniref:PDZ domain-containing protein n=1 Tax=Calcidiscus leptoporus TaxID=127549 RepID=A0A7S0NWE9_9EUKA